MVKMFEKKWSTVIVFLSMAYPVGETIQFFMIGPSWLRWHLSDFGAPCAFGVWLVLFFDTEPFTALKIGLIVTLGWECLQSAIHYMAIATNNSDVMDVITFVLSFLICLSSKEKIKKEKNEKRNKYIIIDYITRRMRKI